MTNIIYQDKTGYKMYEYKTKDNIPKWQRVNNALNELKHTGLINIYLKKHNKLRLILSKSY